MIQPGMTVSLDTGTTTLEVARRLPAIGRLTVLTSSLAIASVLHAGASIELILLGGAVRKDSPDMEGPLTEDNLKRFHVNLAVLAADAVTPAGIYVDTVGIARIAEAILRGAARKVLVADHSKFERAAFVRYAGVDEVDAVVTDGACPPATRAWLKPVARDVIYAEMATEEGDAGR
jgi:DeoR/GlpR family transcriptional regulator of sugar metabolism